MNRLFIYISLLLCCLSSCSEEKDYDVMQIGNDRVNFKAVNLTVGMDSIDSAESVLYRGDFSSWNYRYPNVEFRIDYSYADYPTAGDWVTINLTQTNEVWVGGNNEIEFKFIPSCAEEKSATFTFPDGTTRVLTAADNSFVWSFDEETVKNLPEFDYYTTNFPVYAISEYIKDGKRHINCGYINLDFEWIYRDVLYFDASLNKWMRGTWPTDYSN